MADDMNPKSEQDQEYSFPDKPTQEFGSTPHSGGTETLMSVLQNKRLLMVVGGVVGVYILLNLFSGDDEAELKAAVEEPAIEAEELPMEVSEPVSVEAAPAPISIFAEAEAVEKEPNKVAEDIESLKRQIASVNRQSADFRSQIKQLDNKLDILTKALERNSQQLSTVVKTQQSKETEKKAVEKKQDYKIRAVISGRAWVEDKEGNNMTVKVGDNIPTYGRVTKIRPVEGLIETSSGRVISFSHDE
ncbi:MAG: hypothetical protein VXW87_05010 [Pseudomonadota bacterium]|nr:hypothetical protein [Pseudomonadota bacterium]